MFPNPLFPIIPLLDIFRIFFCFLFNSWQRVKPSSTTNLFFCLWYSLRWIFSSKGIIFFLCSIVTDGGHFMITTPYWSNWKCWILFTRSWILPDCKNALVLHWMWLIFLLTSWKFDLTGSMWVLLLFCFSWFVKEGSNNILGGKFYLNDKNSKLSVTESR